MDPGTYIDENAARFDLPAALISAVIAVESAGDTWAMRHEPHYRWCWDPIERQPYTLRRAQADSASAPDDFPHYRYSSRHTEYMAQRTSWGLMQVMGAVARERGLSQPLPTLCRPGRGIEYGCRHLACLRDRHFAAAGWAGVLDAYNDGSRRIERAHDYPHKVAAVSAEAAALIEV